jgi:hypothetical protein
MKLAARFLAAIGAELGSLQPELRTLGESHALNERFTY